MFLTYCELVNKTVTRHDGTLRSHRGTIGIRRVSLEKAVKVNCGALIAKAVVNVDLDRVPKVAGQGWAGPLSVDANERPPEAVGSC